MKKIKLADLTPDNLNANKGTQRGLGQLEKSLQNYGAGRSITVDKNGRIISGNKTTLAAASVGIEDAILVESDGNAVIVHKRTDIDIDTPMGRGLAIADNRVAELNLDWDLDVLEELADQGVELLDHWTEDELKEFNFHDDGFDDLGRDLGDADEVPEVQDDPISKRGDLWVLGEHRALCGDSTNADDVARLMDGERASICFTSPPYNAGDLNIDGNKETQRKYVAITDRMRPDEYLEFLETSLRLSLGCADEVFYNLGLVSGNKRQVFELIANNGDRFKDIIYWRKTGAAPHIQPGVVNNLVELIIAFGDGLRKFKHAQFSQGSYWNVIEGSTVNNNEYSDIHKAMFPVYLPVEIIKSFSPPASVVLDPFLGTGTTIIAAEETGRKCYGMELSPHYVDVIVRRWQEYTGQAAVHADGHTFETAERAHQANR